MSESLVGLREMERWAEMAIQSTEKRIVKAFEKAGGDAVEHARKNHKFNSQTGRTDKSIVSEVEHKKGDYVSLSFFIDTNIVSIKKGYNLGWLLNDGTFGNYERGAISPTANTVGGEAGSGFKGGDFMGRAWNINTKILEKKIDKAMDGIV